MRVNTQEIYDRLRELLFTDEKPDKEELATMLAGLELAALNRKDNYSASDIREYVNIDLATRVICFLLERY